MGAKWGAMGANGGHFFSRRRDSEDPHSCLGVIRTLPAGVIVSYYTETVAPDIDAAKSPCAGPGRDAGRYCEQGGLPEIVPFLTFI